MRWYSFALGSEEGGFHTAHWHGQAGLLAGQRVDTIDLMPATVRTVDFVPDNPGVWLFHCALCFARMMS